MRLAGKVCFITGTAGGQGLAAAELFEAEGAVVVGCDIKVDGIDLADPVQAAGWIERGVGEAGGIDVLYNNASTTRVGRFEDVTWDDWQFTIRNELDLIFTVTKAAWPHLVARGGGHVINTASGARHGIRVNAISPGLTRTTQIEHLLADPDHPMHAIASGNPLGRMAEPEDIARVALFLASDDAAYVNAAEIVVDGESR